MTTSAPYFTQSRPAIILTILMAACSLVYELALAQSLTALFGGTVLRYSVTIGLYLFGLGLGTFYVDQRPAKHLAHSFFYVQIGLSVLGSLGFISMIAVSVWQFDYPWLVFLYAHGLILVIGFFSGLELPLMNDLNRKRFTETLSFDYWGALIGCVAFPVLLYPQLGLVLTTLLTASVNWALCLYVACHFRLGVRFHALLWTVGLGLAGLVVFEEPLTKALQSIYISGDFNVH